MIGNKKIKNKYQFVANTQIHSAGFTLIELIVSISLFTIIIMSTTQIFSLAISSQRSAIASQNVQESLKYFLEVINKEMRMAQKDTENICGIPEGEIFVISSDSNNNNILRFKNYYDECVSYSLVVDPSVDTTQRFKITRSALSGFISPAKITIDHLYFILKDTEDIQPMITLNLEAHALGETKFKSKMTLQTSISSRYYK
jgi:prepilin-type N-terminal cleavage/methylation domain-containing protein